MAKIKKSTIECPPAALVEPANGQESHNESRQDYRRDSWSSWYDDMCSAPFATEAPVCASVLFNVPAAESDFAGESRVATEVQVGTGSESREFSPPKDIEQAHLVLMARDPYSAYAYWNVPDAQLPTPESPLIMRLYQDVPEAKEEATPKSVDVAPAAPCASQYFEALSANSHYYAELGALQDDGNFIVVASSNSVVTPPDGGVTTTKTDPPPAQVSEDEFRSFGVTEGEVRAYYRELTSRVSQPRRKRTPHDRAVGFLLPMPKSENAPALAYGESSWLLGAGECLSSADAAALFAQIDVEVVVYGRVQPGARLVLEETDVPLRADGTFSMRLAIAPGGLRLPFVARGNGRARHIALAINYSKQDSSVLLSESDDDLRVSEDSLDQLAIDSSGDIPS